MLPATAEIAVLTDDITTVAVADAVHRAQAQSRPGIDGVGHELFKTFLSVLLPALHTAFRVCWKHGNVPAVWKVGTAQLMSQRAHGTRKQRTVLLMWPSAL
ncbi:reverse transcriptase [Phytophthora megakarya]|uniref:Reverse transcriptase n=1 Tax=Phytophthora megakarya TaxID=4795 RepID=A0A225VMI0_9STRA|nr:reverse transcriptase [Phytophthora megakarya]